MNGATGVKKHILRIHEVCELSELVKKTLVAELLQVGAQGMWGGSEGTWGRRVWEEPPWPGPPHQDSRRSLEGPQADLDCV